MVVAKPVKLGVTSIEYEIVTDPVQRAAKALQEAQFTLNSNWLKEHSSEVFAKYRGKFICIAGQEVFAADLPEDAWAMAEAAHPEDEGVVSHFIPLIRAPRI
jgi:hypothetical protein